MPSSCAAAAGVTVSSGVAGVSEGDAGCMRFGIRDAFRAPYFGRSDGETETVCQRGAVNRSWMGDLSKRLRGLQREIARALSAGRDFLSDNSRDDSREVVEDLVSMLSLFAFCYDDAPRNSRQLQMWSAAAVRRVQRRSSTEKAAGARERRHLFLTAIAASPRSTRELIALARSQRLGAKTSALCSELRALELDGSIEQTASGRRGARLWVVRSSGVSRASTASDSSSRVAA